MEQWLTVDSRSRCK